MKMFYVGLDVVTRGIVEVDVQKELVKHALPYHRYVNLNPDAKGLDHIPYFSEEEIFSSFDEARIAALKTILHLKNESEAEIEKANNKIKFHQAKIAKLVRVTTGDFLDDPN